jgi:hypothetical protein
MIFYYSGNGGGNGGNKFPPQNPPQNPANAIAITDNNTTILIDFDNLTAEQHEHIRNRLLPPLPAYVAQPATNEPSAPNPPSLINPEYERYFGTVNKLVLLLLIPEHLLLH